MGDVLASSAYSVSAGFSSELVDALAVFRGLLFACDTGLLPCSVETDAQGVVKLINSGSAAL